MTGEKTRRQCWPLGALPRPHRAAAARMGGTDLGAFDGGMGPRPDQRNQNTLTYITSVLFLPLWQITYPQFLIFVRTGSPRL